MSNLTVCARFRPLSSTEKSNHGDSVCIRCIDTKTFIFKDEKEEELMFSFDRVFYEESEQAQVYEFLALPIVQGAVNAINGTIITYGQTGAGKTYSMEGPSILECDEQKKGLLPRVVHGLFECIKSSDESIKYTIKLSMVGIYMEKVRDLFDLKKDNIQINDSKVQGILLSGVTKIPIQDRAKALESLQTGIRNRATAEIHMNIASSRSHCVYVFTVQQKLTKGSKTGKLILVDLAGSEKLEQTGAGVPKEAETINKSLSALGNVINALACGSPGNANVIPYRDSKLTRILQEAIEGNSRTALLCCCSPSHSNALESLSTLRFATSLKVEREIPMTRKRQRTTDADADATRAEMKWTISPKAAKMSKESNAVVTKVYKALVKTLDEIANEEMQIASKIDTHTQELLRESSMAYTSAMMVKDYSSKQSLVIRCQKLWLGAFQCRREKEY